MNPGLAVLRGEVPGTSGGAISRGLKDGTSPAQGSRGWRYRSQGEGFLGGGLLGGGVSEDRGPGDQGTGAGLLKAEVTGFPNSSPSPCRPVPTRLWRRGLNAGCGGKLRLVSVVHQPHARDPLQLLRGVHLRRSHHRD